MWKGGIFYFLKAHIKSIRMSVIKQTHTDQISSQ